MPKYIKILKSTRTITDFLFKMIKNSNKQGTKPIIIRRQIIHMKIQIYNLDPPRYTQKKDLVYN